MNNNFFNIHVFADTMRRLKLIGLLTTIVFIIEAIAIPVSNYISYTQYSKVSTYDYTQQIYSFLDIHPFLIGLFIIIMCYLQKDNLPVGMENYL